VGTVEAVQVGAVLPSEGEEIRKAAGGAEHRAREASFKERIRRDGSSVCEGNEQRWRDSRPGKSLAKRRHHPEALIMGGGWYLCAVSGATDEHARVGEGAANVDTGSDLLRTHRGNLSSLRTGLRR
jgi:hypothetical protein